MESNRKINCEDCVKHNPAPVSYLVHESIMVRQERTIRRLWILCLVLIIALIGTNLAWTVYENGFTDTVITQQNDAGYNNYIGNDGDIINGHPND